MTLTRVTQAVLLCTLLGVLTSLPVRACLKGDPSCIPNGDGNEVESFLNQLSSAGSPWSASLMKPEDFLEVRLRHLLSAGLDRRRQLGDIEFSNKYAEFLRSKAKHTSICSFLRRMQSVKMSGVGGDTERVNLLLQQYMCPSVLNSWPSPL